MMKRFLMIMVISLMSCNVGYAEEIKVDQKTTITELLDAGYKYKDRDVDLVKDKYGRRAVKIFTLKKGNSTIICTVSISINTGSINSTKCKKP